MRSLASRAAVLVALLPLWIPAAAHAQSPAVPDAGSAASKQKPIELSILTSPAGGHLSLTGESDVAGVAPLDLPTLWTGRYSVVISGAGFSETQALLYIPPRGGLAYSLSEPSGVTAGLVLRSLNYPGLGALTSHHTFRGAVLAGAATGALGLGVRAHLFYRNTLKHDDLDADERGKNFRRNRDQWAGYLGAVWGGSLVDYCIRSRMTVVEATTSRITLSAPTVSRGGIVWRSLLVPGAGQEYANHRARGLFWLSAALAAGAGHVVFDGVHQTDVSQLRQAKRDLANADSTQIQKKQRDVNHRSDDVQTSADLRDGFRTAIIATYIASFLDAFIVPVHRGIEVAEPAKPAKVSATTRFIQGGTAVGLRYRF